MWNTFSNLAQANVDHYNDHPVAHSMSIAAYAVVAGVAIHKMAKRINKEDDSSIKSGQFAK
jgi:5-enolpyruvylshikimate-3-phosphate synthase